MQCWRVDLGRVAKPPVGRVAYRFRGSLGGVLSLHPLCNAIRAAMAAEMECPRSNELVT